MKQITELKLPIVFALPFLMVALIGTVMPPAFADHDDDTIDDTGDNCPEVANEEQADTEKHGKVHLEDEDEDGVVDFGVVHILTQDVCNAPGVENGSVSVTLSDGSFEGTDTILIKKK